MEQQAVLRHAALAFRYRHPLGLARRVDVLPVKRALRVPGCMPRRGDAQLRLVRVFEAPGGQKLRVQPRIDAVMHEFDEVAEEEGGEVAQYPLRMDVDFYVFH